MTEWQDISSAPKDGSYFIAACFGYGKPDYEVVCYNPLVYPEYVDAGDGLYRREERTVMEWHASNWHRMTHWMPLPPPPASTLADSDGDDGA